MEFNKGFGIIVSTRVRYGCPNLKINVTAVSESLGELTRRSKLLMEIHLKIRKLDFHVMAVYLVHSK